VGTRGNPQAPIVTVGESPGREEAKEGIPFVGESGQILWGVTPGGEDADVYVTNAIHCFPFNKENRPKDFAKALKLCRGRLLKEVQSHPRRVILALGNEALWSLTNDYTTKITQCRGILVPSPLAEYGILPAVHPAALLRGTGTLRQLRADVQYAHHLANGGAPRTFKEPEIVICETNLEVAGAIRYLSRQKYLAADIETSGFNPRHDRILCLGVAAQPNQVLIFPDTVLHKLRSLFEAKKPRWIWHAGKFDMSFLRPTGLKARVDEDTLLLSYALDETGGVHDLDQVALDALGAPNHKHLVKPYAPKKTDSYENVPKPTLYRYLSLDVNKTLGIFCKYRPLVADDKHLEKLYTRSLVPSSDVYGDMERVGIKVDLEWVAENSKRLTEEVEVTRSRINEIAGYSINPASPQQMVHLLYNVLRIRTRRRNTRKETLEKLAPHPAIQALREFRKAAKALSTYVVGIEKRVDTDGRIHSSFLIHGTTTGRPASRDPNVLNIPRDPQLRGMYIAEDGKILIEVDLSQAEIRTLACLSKDVFLCGIYNSSNRSLHKEVAIDQFGADYTEDQYFRAKAVNFGIPYGRKASSLAEEFDIPVSEGQKMIDDWLARAPGASDFITKCRSAPRNGEAIITTFGRKKRFHLITRKNLDELQNQASNFPHQSLAADITLHSALRVQDLLRAVDVNILNLIYDAILMECPDDQGTIAYVIKIVVEAMETIPKEWGLIEVPFKAGAKVGHRWGHLKEAA